MKLVRFNANSEPTTTARLGIVINDMVGDLTASYANLRSSAGDAQAYELAQLRLPPLMSTLLAAGSSAWEALEQAADNLASLVSEPHVQGKRGEQLFLPLDEVRLHAPIRPPKMIACGRNYSEHLKQAGVEVAGKVPCAWGKAVSSITGPNRPIIKPDCVKLLDYETELAVVIGKKCKNVPKEKAYDVILGYTVVNDISARDIVRIEKKEGHQLLGKMFDTFAPMGPWLVTKDEIADPMNLRIKTRVNGEARQDGNTKDMIWSIPQLISYVSQLTLHPGDIILTGTPEGCANGRDASLPSWFLEPGDILESEIEGIGVLKNKIAAAPKEEVSWQW